ncbi:MAG TPA: sugar ABC transporter permease [Terriglobia bacterium]|nr:sugar ABC transporter permease [Terriglobia bacterium]
MEPQNTARTPRHAHNRAAALFLLPAFAFLGIFIVWPILMSIRLSFFDWNGISPTQTFVGLDNWRSLASDRIFWKALGNNFIVVIASIAIQMPVAMALAVLLHRGGRKFKAFKVVYFFPMLMSTVAIGTLFKAVYNVQFGAINPLLEALGLGSLAHDWLGDSRIALLSVIAVICWQFIPFYMILFLARLTGIPNELREAAAIDGATGAQLFWRVEFPMMRGIILTAMTLSLIGSLKYFDLIWVMTEGGPSRATELMATYMYKEAFSSFRVGYGSAIATAMFVVVMIMALTTMAAGRSRARTVEG